MEVKKELEKVRKDGFELYSQEKPIAMEVLTLMKVSLRKTYFLLLISIILFVISVVDSIYQRCKIIDILNEKIEIQEVYKTRDKNVEIKLYESRT